MYIIHALQQRDRYLTLTFKKKTNLSLM